MKRDVLELKIQHLAGGALHRKIVEEIPALKRGRVWCRHCGAMLRVDSAECLRRGWPLCCGETMSIDQPKN